MDNTVITEGRRINALFHNLASGEPYAYQGRVELIRPGFFKIFMPGTLDPFHVFLHADGPLFHSHPWDFITTIISGGYVEEVRYLLNNGSYVSRTFERLPGTQHRVKAGTIHRVIHLLGEVCVTRVSTSEPYHRTALYDFREDGIFRQFEDEPGAWHLLSGADVLALPS